MSVVALDLTLPEGEESSVVTDDGAALGVTVAGPVDGADAKGPTVVFAHGWTNNRSVWAPAAKELLVEGHRVVLYDQRGHGSSTTGDDAPHVKRLGADLACVLDQLELTDVVLVGHSMGGFTTLAFACGHPDELAARVRGLVLVSTAAHGVGFGRFGPAMSSVLGPVLDWAVASPRVGSAVMRRMMGRKPNGTHISSTREMYLATPRHVRADCFNGFGSMDLRADLASLPLPLPLPTAVLVGRRDRLTPPRLGRTIASAIPGATFEVLPEAGHMLPLERPDEVLAAIRRVALAGERPS